MKKTLSLLFAAVFAASLHAQTAKSRSDLYTEIDTQLASNQQMSAATLRATIKNLTASSYNALTDGQALTASAANSLYQPLSSQLSNLAALSGSNVIYYRNSSGSWVSVTVGSGLTFSGGTLSSTAGGGNMSTSVYDTDGNGIVDTASAAAALQTARTINGVSFNGTANITVADSTKEPVITAGTASQFWRGDKSWQTLDKTAVGLGNVDNTSDAGKPVSTATQTALDLKAPLNNPTFTGTVTIPTLTATTFSFTNWGTGTVPDANIASTIARDSEVSAAVGSVTPTSLGLVIGTNVQAYNSNLTTWAGKTAPTGTVVGTTDTQTLTNKRLTRRVATLTDSATVTPDVDSYDAGILTTLSQTTTIANPTGTPTDMQTYVLRIKSTSARSLSFGAQFRGSTDIALPTTTSGSSLTDYFGFVWNAADSKWDIIAKTAGF